MIVFCWFLYVKIGYFFMKRINMLIICCFALKNPEKIFSGFKSSILNRLG